MAKTTFSGPVKSLGGFISAGAANDISLTADTTLTVADHAGRVLRVNDADGVFTLPTIVATSVSDQTDPNQTNNVGATFTFFIETAATDLDIKTDGTDKFVEQGASTAGKPKQGESAKMKSKRKSFKSRHGKNIAKGKSSAAYWADKVKW
jgi:hypothetical protein